MEEQEPDLNDLVDIAIDNENDPDYVTSIEKNNTENKLFYIVFIIFLSFNILLGFLVPPFTNETYKTFSVDFSSQSQSSVYSITIPDLNSKCSFVKVFTRYIRKNVSKDASLLVDLKTSISYVNSRSEHAKHVSDSKSTNFTALNGSNSTNWNSVYYERLIDFDSVTAEVSVVGKNDVFSGFEMKAEVGSFSNFAIQIWIRSFYTVVLLFIIANYNKKIKSGAATRHEQTLTQGILFSTAFFDNVSFLISYVMPDIVIIIFDDILKSFYCGYLIMFVLILIGRLGTSEKITFNFLSTRITFAGSYGLFMMGKILLIDLAQVYNPMMGVDHVDKYLVIISLALYAWFAVKVIHELVKAGKRIDSSDKFKFAIYVYMSLSALFIIAGVQGFLGDNNSVLFMSLMGASNVLAILMAYANYPIEEKEDVEYQEAVSAESFDNELMESDGKLSLDDNIDGDDENSSEHEEEEEPISLGED